MNEILANAGMPAEALIKLAVSPVKIFSGDTRMYISDKWLFSAITSPFPIAFGKKNTLNSQNGVQGVLLIRVREIARI